MPTPAPVPPFTVVGLGEVLWDLFPQGKQLGGAPANFAYITSLLGDQGVVASRVGTDALGDEVDSRFKHLSLPTDFLQFDSVHPTGTVKVSVDGQGQPQYEITEGSAWDYFEMTPQWRELASQASAISFGSLAQRAPASRATIRQFLKAASPSTIRVFDVNLRQAFFSKEVIVDSARQSDIIKVNHEELPRILEFLDAPGASSFSFPRDSAEWLLQASGARLVCVTRGDQGSLLVTPSGFHEHSGLRVRPVDTVGAGDAFTAALLHHYLRGASLAQMNEAANRMGAWVVSHAGATPVPEPVVLEQVRNA